MAQNGLGVDGTVEYAERFYDPTNEAGYAGARNLLRVSARGKRLNAKEKARLYEWLDEQDAYTLHKPVKRRFPRLSYNNIHTPDELWEMDLMQLTSLKEENDGHCYVLVVVDVLSKKAWVECLKDKTSRACAAAFEKILKRTEGRKAECVQSDKGGEFQGAFKSMLERHGIKYRSARNPDIKAAVCERLIRTLKERLWRYFSHANTHRYIDVIQKIVQAYNGTVHSGTRFRPNEVTLQNAAKARANLLKRASQQSVNKNRGKEGAGSTLKYPVNTLVRISRTKNTFSKGYEKNYSEEIFRIKRVSLRQGLYTYVLQDLNNEEIDGFFYTEELARVGEKRLSADQTFKIERVLQTRGRGKNKQALVKFVGYPSSFNQWIKYSELRPI